MPDTFPRWLQEAIERRGESMAGLGRLIGVERSAVFQWCSGITKPSTRNFGRLLDVLEVAEDQRPTVWQLYLSAHEPEAA